MARPTRQIAPSGARSARVGPSRPGSASAPTRQRRAARAQLIAQLNGVLQSPEPSRHFDARSAVRYLETVRGFKPPPPPMSPAEQQKLAELEADQMVGVIRAVLEGLKLSDADYTRGLDIAIEALRAASTHGWEPL